MIKPNRKLIKYTHRADGYNYNPNVFAPGAKCPNHKCRLYMTDQKGIGICEISHVYFNYEEGPDVNAKQNHDREFTIKIINGQPQKVLNRPTVTRLDISR